MKELFIKVREKFMKEMQNSVIPGKKYHLEGDSWSHTMMAFTLAKNIFMKNIALLHDLGKPMAKKVFEDKILYRGHEGISTHIAFGFVDDIKRQQLDPIPILYTINYHGVTWQKSKKQIEKYFAKDIEKLSLIFQFREIDKRANINFDNIWKEEIHLNDLNFQIVDKKINPKGTIHMLCGLPNSGKSTFTKKLNLPVLSRDDIITEMCPGRTYNEAWNIVDQKEVDKKLMEKAKTLKNENEFIIDMTNLSWKSRRKWFEYYKDFEFKVYFFATPIETIFGRNEKREGKHIAKSVIISMMERTELPLKNEGNISEIEFIFP